MGMVPFRGQLRHVSGMRRRINRTPQLESDQLERRDLMAAGAFGINIYPEYVDLAKQNADWAPIPNWVDPTQSSGPTFDQNGWPTSDVGMGAIDLRTNQWWNGPDPGAVTPNISGRYHLSFKGQATLLNWASDLRFENQVYNAATNTTTADIVENQVGDNAWMGFYFLQTKNPQSATGKGVTDVRLIRPGYAADTTQLFTTRSLVASAGFDTVRLYDASRPSDYTATSTTATTVQPVEWSQRRLPTDASQTNNTYGKIGQSWEYQVALANTLNSNLWINVPGPATDDYIWKLADLIKNGSTLGGVTYAGLKPNLKVYVEYSNEVWGGLANPYHLNRAMTRQYMASGGSPLNSDGTTDLGILAGRFYLMRSAQISKIFQQVFGGNFSESRVRPVVEWQQGGYQFFRDQLPWFAANFGAPNEYFYGMGGATYLYSTDYSSVDNMFASMRSSAAATASSLVGMSAVARYYGLKNIAYEGGPHIGANPGTPEGAVSMAASRDPRMTSLILDSYKAFYAAGLDLGLYYKGLFEIWTPLHQWSAVEASQADNPTASPKYRGLRAVLAADPVSVNLGRPVSRTGPTDISLGVDDVGLNTKAPLSGVVNTWLLNAVQGGVYRLNMVTDYLPTSVSAPAVIQLLLNDRTVVGTYRISPNSTIDLGSFPLQAGLNTLAIKNIHALYDPAHPDAPFYNAYLPIKLTLSPVSLTTNPSVIAAPTVSDGSFERSVLPDSSLRYSPINTGWIFDGSAGLSTENTYLTYANPTAPEGRQVLFIQQTGMVSQVINNWAAGSYTLSLMAARRAYVDMKPIQVLVDGKVVATFAPNSTNYQKFTTPSFIVTAGTHTIAIRGVETASNAEYTLVDSVSLAASTTSTTPPQSLVSTGSDGAPPALTLPTKAIAIPALTSPALTGTTQSPVAPIVTTSSRSPWSLKAVAQRYQKPQTAVLLGEKSPS